MTRADRLAGWVLLLIASFGQIAITNPNPTITVDSSSVQAGNQVQAKGAEFDRCLSMGRRGEFRPEEPQRAPVVFTLTPVGIGLGSVSPQDDGTFSATLTVPLETPAGQYNVSAQCDRSVADRIAGVPPVTVPLTVTAAPPPPSSSETRPPPPTRPPSETFPPPRPRPSSEIISPLQPVPLPASPAPPPSPPPGPAPSGGNPALGVLGVVGVVAALVGLGALGRRLRRGRAPGAAPSNSAGSPVVHAVLTRTFAGPVGVRETGAEPTVAVRVVLRAGRATPVRVREEPE